MKKTESIRIAILAAVAGAVAGGVGVYLAVNHFNAKRQREAYEIYSSTLASTRLAALTTLRDSGEEEALAMLEATLASDQDALKLIRDPSPTTGMMLRRIADYQKKFPLPAATADSQE